MEEDDLDFIFTQGSSSNLASLFSFNKKPLEGNSSLTYVAPKGPNRESSPRKKQPVAEKSNKGVIICSKSVQAYKREDKSYADFGRTGIVLTGNYKSSVYCIIIYNRFKEHLVNVTITKTFMLILSEHNYLSFYDNKKEIWSVLFGTSGDLEQFVEKVAISKFYCHPGTSENILIQDLSPASSVQSHSNSMVEITYKYFSLNADSMTLINENVKEKIDLSDSNSALAKGLLGCSENSYRILIIPHSLAVSWLNDIEVNKDVLFKIKIEKIISQVENTLLNNQFTADSTDNPLSLSFNGGEEFKAKSEIASVKNSANVKSKKADLISRMAKMGQATLPLTSETESFLSDFKEDDGQLSPSKTIFKTKLSGGTSQMSGSLQMAQTLLPEAFSTHQNEHVSLQQLQLAKYSVPQQVIPVSFNSASLPTVDPGFSFYISESRIQAAELRMNVSKMLDKMDLVLLKVQNLDANTSESKSLSPESQNHNSILSGVQNLIKENEQLRTNVQEQKNKLEQQNERIFHLLELNQRYLERNSTCHRQSDHKQSVPELQSSSESEDYLEKDRIFKEHEAKSEQEIQSLKSQLKVLEDEIKTLKKINEDLTAELESNTKIIEKNNSMKSSTEGCEEKLKRASDIIIKLKDKLKETISENKNLKCLIESQKEDMKTSKDEFECALKLKTEEYEKTSNNIQNKIMEDKSKNEQLIQDFKNTIRNLEEEKKKLLLDLKNEREEREMKVKAFQELLYLNLKSNLEKLSDYSYTTVFSIIEKCFKNVNVSPNSNPVDEGNDEKFAKENESSPTYVSGIESTETAKKEEETLNLEKDFKNPLLNQKKDSPYYTKTYDQLWNSFDPTPPPLEDDDEDDDWLN